MVVLLPNCTLGVRRRVVAQQRDAYGDRVGLGWGEVIGPADGRRNEDADGMWNLAVDPSVWPLRQDDLVMSLDGATWLVDTADYVPHSYDDYVEYVRVTARLRSVGGTEPGGAWFVARYAPGLDDVPAPPDDLPVLTEAHLWVGAGPPVERDDWRPREGDEYLDRLTGIVYRLGED